MAKNDFKAFATDRNANVISQEEWEALPALLSGFTAGKASSAQVNKVIRQASFIAAALAQYTANKSGLDVLDDGDLNGFITKMSSAFGKDYQALDATLTALAGLATGANKLPYFTGTDKAAQTDLTKVGRDIIGKNTIADILAYLGFTSGPGWMKFPDGTIIQFGTSISGPIGYPTTVHFPIPFTSGYRIATSFDSAINGATDCPAFATTPAGGGLLAFYLMSSRTGGTGAGANWIAIGK
ncbi:gp53-like domain-containing protein [Escherichia sp. 93.1447]|uniref:gp53-like domain-containing protein n=1 Tax=Escherichia sp. 93.1447 TaxID=2723309 RepID=UPI0031583CBA